MTLAELLRSTRPETLGRVQGTWSAFIPWLWQTEGDYMSALVSHLAAESWCGGPITIDGDVIQDGHHRIVATLALGRLDWPLPLEAI